MDSTEIAVISANPIFRVGLETVLGAFFPVLQGHASAGEAVVAPSRPDIYLFDAPADAQKMVEEIGILRQMAPRVPVTLLCPSQTPGWAGVASSAGAAAILPRDAMPEMLVQVLRVVALGGQVFPATLSFLSTPAAEEPAVHRLTRRERQILEMLTEGVSNKVIAKRLAVTEATVKAHVTNILDKLGVENRTQAALVAFGPQAAVET